MRLLRKLYNTLYSFDFIFAKYSKMKYKSILSLTFLLVVLAIICWLWLLFPRQTSNQATVFLTWSAQIQNSWMTYTYTGIVESNTSWVMRYAFFEDATGDYNANIPELKLMITIPKSIIDMDCKKWTGDRCLDTLRWDELSWGIIVSGNTIVLWYSYDIRNEYADKTEQWFDSIMSIKTHKKDSQSELYQVVTLPKGCSLDLYTGNKPVVKLWNIPSHTYITNPPPSPSVDVCWERINIYHDSPADPTRYISATYAFQDIDLLQSFAIITFLP